MMPSGHKAFIVNNVKDVELLLMHNKTYAAEYVDDSQTEQRPGMRNRSGLTLPEQDCPQRLFPKACRDHCPREATERQGHQPQGARHD